MGPEGTTLAGWSVLGQAFAATGFSLALCTMSSFVASSLHTALRFRTAYKLTNLIAFTLRCGLEDLTVVRPIMTDGEPSQPTRGLDMLHPRIWDWSRHFRRHM